LVNICGYELPTNLLNFMQDDLTKVKICEKRFREGATFLKHCVAELRYSTPQRDKSTAYRAVQNLSLNKPCPLTAHAAEIYGSRLVYVH